MYTWNKFTISLANKGWHRWTFLALFSQWIRVIKWVRDLGRELKELGKNSTKLEWKLNCSTWFCSALSLRNELHVLGIALCFQIYPDYMQWKSKALHERNAESLTQMNCLLECNLVSWAFHAVSYSWGLSLESDIIPFSGWISELDVILFIAL